MTGNGKDSTSPPTRLRIALIAGTLGQAGAEKQLVYMARSLRDAGADLRVYSLTKGEFYEAHLRELGIKPRWFGWSGSIRFANIPLRLASLALELARFRPHIVQSGHFFCNLYAGLCGRLSDALTIGAMRNDLDRERKAQGRLIRLLLRLPSVIIANSRTALRGMDEFGVNPESIVVLENVIDLEDFDARLSSGGSAWDADGPPVALAVGRMHREKRFDRFLAALALARRASPVARGVLVGDGPEWPILRQQAQDLGLLPDGVTFLGRRNDVPALLDAADLLVLSSDHEGCPNVVMEAMAARQPVVTTPAGDAGLLVEDGVSGYVVPFNDVEAMADRMARLAKSHELRRRFGEAGRRRVENVHNYDGLAGRLISIYELIAGRHNRQDVLAAIANLRVPFGLQCPGRTVDIQEQVPVQTRSNPDAKTLTP
jgi:glycosyltransferase involved in cell wall biosynthesis